jgi:hypothetical protein
LAEPQADLRGVGLHENAGLRSGHTGVERVSNAQDLGAILDHP